MNTTMEITKKLEIEKRYLLKGLPSVNFDEIQHITQYYGPSGRLRHTNGHSYKDNRQYTQYLQTIKHTISPGVNEENECEITEAEFIHEKTIATKYIHKTRYIKYYNGLKWEIDVFSFKLVIAEVELETIEQLNTVQLPEFLESVLIQDITGQKDFANYKLADTIKKK